MFKTVILDAFTTNPGDLSWDWLKSYGDLQVFDRTLPDEIDERIKNADIIITNKTPLPKDKIDKMQNVKFIALLSTGYNIVDYNYAKEKNIPVANIPSYSTHAVAQLVFAFISEFACGVGLHSETVKNGEWSKCPDFCYWKQPLIELFGKTIGIVGFGKIGQRVADIAQAYGMNIIAVSAHQTDQSARKNFSWVSLDELAQRADFITFHCPLLPETENLVDKKFLSKCKKTAFIINTARGPVINDIDLAAALNNNQIAGAGLDVLSVEPPKDDNPLLKAKNCLITPHIAWAGFETRSRLIDILKENIEAFVSGKPINIVNK